MIDLLKTSGYELPPRETDYSNLTTKEIMDKIAEFMRNANPKYEYLIPDFWQIIADYPVSMCERRMSDTLKLLINLFYYYKVPHNKMKDKVMQKLWDRVREKLNKEGFFSYEELARVFTRSKASIHDAIKDKELEVKQIVEEVSLRRHARSIAFQEMIKEEKSKLLTQNV